MRWEPLQQWTKKFAWIPIGINCGTPNTGLGQTVWLEFVHIRYVMPHERLVQTTEEYRKNNEYTI